MILEIENLHAKAGDAAILDGIDLRVAPGEVHAIMGPNGSGKSTLAHVIAGREGYEVTAGSVRYCGQDLLEMSPEERACAGIFLAFQYPIEVPGVSNLYFLRTALNAQRRQRGEEELDAMDFLALAKERMKLVRMDMALMKRSVNEGFSGGEKKRNEIFQMAVLDPKLAVLDETDSGLDIDALRTVADGVNALRDPERGMILVTHYQRLLDYIVPDKVHVLYGGRIAKSGDKSLALELEKRGYSWIEAEAQADEAVSFVTTLQKPTLDVDHLRAQLAALEKDAPAAGARLRELRETAFAAFVETGFPTRRQEDWRFTDVGHLGRRAWRLAPPPDGVKLDDALQRDCVAYGDGPRLVFGNGYAWNSASRSVPLPDGVRVASLTAMLAEAPELVEPHLGHVAAVDAHPFVAFNTAFARDGGCVVVPDGVVVEQPIVIVHVSTHDAEAALHAPRHLVVVGRNAQVTLVEHYAARGEGESLTTPVTEIRAADGAIVDHYRVVRERERDNHVGVVRVAQGRDSAVDLSSIFLAGGLARTDSHSVLGDTGASCTLLGLYLARGRQHVDNHTTVDHASPHCSSRELYKGVLAERSTVIFNGKVIVRPDAQKTDAQQSNKNLLLSDDATLNTKPELQIEADDVKCSHGATIGQLDPEAEFYLRSRGIPGPEARRLLIRAFVGDVLERMRLTSIAERVEADLERWLAELRQHEGVR